MATISEIYKRAVNEGIIGNDIDESAFKEMMQDDEERKDYWNHAQKYFKGFYSDDFNTFSTNIHNAMKPSVAEHPAPTTAQEDSINLAKQNEGEQQYNVVTPVVSSPTQTMDYNAMTLAELQQVRNEQLRKAQASKERRVSEQKLWEQEHPFIASVAAMRGGGAYTDKSVGETLKEVDADQFAEDSKDQNAVKEALGRKLYESNYNNIGGEVERMQSVVANISREDKKLGERKDLDKAEYVLDQAHRLATAPSKYDPSTNGLVNFGKGIADNTNRDLIPAVELIRDVNINNAIKKMNDGKELTEGERALILSYITYSDVQQARQYDLPMGYQAGAAAAESIPFMAEMLLTKGASKLAVSQVIRIMKAAGKTADQINDFAKWMNLGAKGIKVDDVVYGAVEEGAKRTAGSVVRNTASELVGTTLQTAAMPSTYQGMVEDNMRTRLATGENDIEGYNMNNLRNFGNAWVQTLTERKGGELIDWGLGKIMPFDKIWHTKAGNQMVANQFFQSPVAETLEEYLAAVINYGRSFNPLYSEESNAQLKQEAEDMFTAEGLGTTFLSMLPNTILGGAVNLYDVHKTSNDYNNARSKVLGELVKSGATKEQAENILMQIETSNEEEMREKFGILYSHFNIENAGGAGAKAAEEYIKAAQAYQFSVADLANKFANLTPEEQAQAQQEMQDFTSQVRQKAVEHEARMFAQTQAGEATNEDGNIYQVTRADGTTPEGSRMYISAGNVVTTDDGKGQQIIDRTQSSKDVFVTTYDADGNANVEHVALDELDLLFAPTSRQQVEDELYSMFMQEYAMTQQMAAQQAAQQATQAQGQQVVGEDNGQQPLGATEGEQASNIEGRQFTNGQQTITASNPDSNGNVTLSAPVTLSNGVVTDQVMPQQVFDDLMSGLISEEGWQEVIPQPAAQGQTQGQQQAPIVWSEMDANQATATVVERSKGDKERAKKFAQKQVEVKTKALQEAQAEMDAFEGDDLDAFNAVQDKVDAAQADVDKWTAVANGIDAYVAPVQPSGNISATSASGNGVVTEDVRQSTSNPQQSANNSQNTLQNEKKSVSLQEKKRKRAQEIIDKIHGGNNTVYLFDMNDIIKVLEDAGVSQISIDNVKKQIAQMGKGDVIGGFQIGNKIFINYDQDENEIRRKYIHERQHILTTPQLANKIASSMSWEELFDVVCNLCGSRAYQDRNAIDLAHELISFSMEWVYEYDNNQIVRGVLKQYGLNEEQILTLINLGNEQRKDNTLSRARRTAYVNNSRQGSGRQDGRDLSENSTRDMEGQGVRPSITSESRIGRPSEVGQDTALEESGIQVNDETGDARFSVNYRLDANQMDILAEQIAERVGVSKAKAKKWLKAETSLAALCMQEDNVDALYYFADGRYGAIKSNSDYPQGTVDFNNICRKRLDFTNIYLSLQREFPNKVFTAKDLETIRQIMIEDGLEVACGLCYVEDRRQLLGEIANEFRGFLKDRVIPEDLSATKKEVMQKVLDMVGDDTYIPTIAQLLEAGAYELRNSHPSIFEAFVVFNNSRGMQSGRLFEGYAEYKREILDWSDKKVKQVNDAGGLRIFSFSDFEAHHLIDIVQIISDAASKGVMIQGYTKVPEFARAIRNTKVKLNRSLIPLGDTGIQEVNGEKVLAYDTTEGIDVNSENFLDESNNPNVGNVLVGINDEQIRMAMDDTNVDYIIPFHTGLKKDILLQKKIGAWVNYKNSQTEKDTTTGSSKTADGKKVVGVNIYTDVLQAAEKEGTPIKNRKEFVEYFLKVCKERGLVPRFEQFLARGKNGEYKYTKGYEKLLVDFKMFDKRGNILPQEPVVPIFDDAFNQQIIEDYVKGTKETKEYESTKEKIKENLQLNESTDDLAASESQVRYSVVTDKKKIEELESSEKMKGYRTVILNEDGTFSSPMATGLGNKGKTSAKTSGFELGKWEQAEERPELADENGKINLKPKEGGDTYVDYNPYIHNRLDKINTQFTSAWRKPFLVYIETEIPMSDIESGYHAEKAALSVGVHPWNGGDLVLSRYDKPVRIVPWDEVADAWAEQFDEVTFDIVNPELLPLLHERGVKILPPKKAAKEKAFAAYKKWKAENSKPRFSISSIAEDAWTKYQYDGELKTIRDVIDYVEENMPDNDQTKSLFDAIETYKEEEFEDRQYYGMRGDLEPFADAILEELETLMNSKPRFSVTFASVNEELNTDGISIDNDVLMEEYGLSSIELSKKDNYIKLGKIVVADKGKGNGSRFMEDLTKYADANGYTLTLTPDTSYGASSIARLKKFYKEFGFKDNKGRNTDYNVWESMLRTPKSTRFSITAAEDKAYADAVARGDMETAQDMLRDAAERAGYAPLGDYKDMHQAPSATVEKEDFTNIEALQEQLDNGNVDSNLFAIAQGVTAAPQDYFSPQGARWYGYGNLSGMESYSALNNAIRSINAQLREYGEVRDMPKVKVYRAVPKNIKGAQLESEGQWVSPSREYAVGHGRHRFGFNQYRIIEQEVPADQLWWDANDIREWGFDDGTVNVYQNTKNNRKLYEVTYDDNGELIPLSKRFDKRKANVRFSVTAQEDAAYMDAVNRGDMETAQRMVNEAAKKAMPNTKVVDENGNPLVVYHVSQNKFTVFDIDKVKGSKVRGFKGFYFADASREENFKNYGNNRMSVFLNIENPYIDDSRHKRLIGDEKDKEVINKIVNGKENGTIDGVIAKNGQNLIEYIVDTLQFGGDSLKPNQVIEYIAFYHNQIKSADPVTYDDNGNVIPLSERFNNDKSDIRFSIIGERGAANLDRAEEATTRLDNLAVAREMESANKDAKTIKMATGWERGADGKWRYEIEDIKLKENPEIQNNGYYNFIDLKDLLDNSALLESYPRGSFAQIDEQTGEPYGMVNMSLGDIRVFFDRFTRNASYEESGKNIWMPDFFRSFIGTNREELFRVVLSHEIQHAIQDAEGFAKGADVNDENYESYAGEVEARNVESRLGMSAEERRATLLSETEDVARKDQLFIFDAIEGDSRNIQFKDASEERISDKVLRLFHEAKEGKLTGKPVKIGVLTTNGKRVLEELSGLKMKEKIDFRLNPSDLVHIYNDHYKDNEKDKSNNIPLSDYDIKRIVDVIAYPTDIVYGEDEQGRKMFYFLRQEPQGAYNLLEIYSDGKGNLTTKTYYKTRKGVSQRVMDLQSLLPTSKTYSGSTLSAAKLPQIFDISKLFEEKSEDLGKNIRFSLSNANQRIFVSNAERAVESIKQEKATPQQWKAMIEKQGGLKAGEDKWLGLSEWLDSKVAPAQEGETMGETARRVAKNTITKQEILDYIAEHQIQIEEVEYAEAASSERLAKLDDYREEFAQLMAEAEDMEMSLYKDDDAQWAFDQMIERYGDDFSYAFEYDENYELQPIEDMYGDYSAADYFLGEGSKTIDETRMRYTTEGLEDKKEIALTVPTIESWNEGDEVHFGDAGNGRAIAWIRFGETEMRTPREVIDDVDELQFAYTNANGRDVYAPQGSKFSKDYVVYGKLANGEMGYVLYVRDKQLSAHPTLEAALEALNAHYEANPRQVTDYDKVLVIDEIQSKRHQEGREKGYATKKDRDIKKKIAKLTDQQDAIFDAMRAREEGRAGITNFTEEETAELKRLGEEIKQLQSELSANNGIIPDAPFDKNWHELAFKRMLRYAAENGYDYVAWTTGEQQAQRYNLGDVVDKIRTSEDFLDGTIRVDIDAKNTRGWTLYVTEDGTITNRGAHAQANNWAGKPLSDVVGKPMAEKILSNKNQTIEGEGLMVGGEGMKAFYDKMLPSFVSKYTKKWGAKVQDINLPNLEESAQTMHAVNVTQEMKDSVMEGQVMFSVKNTAEDLRMSQENATFAEQYRWGDTLLDEDYISEAYSKEMDAFYDALYTVENPLTEAERNKAMQAKARAIEEFLLKLNYNTPNLHVISSLENMRDELENAGVQADVIDTLIQEEEAIREKKKVSWGMKLFDSVYVFAEPMHSLIDAQLTFAHEMQHIENEKNKKLLADIVDVTSPQELNNILIALGTSAYSPYLNEKEDGFIALADEVVAHMMEYGFALGKDGNLAEALKRDGLENTELINLLQQEYERRKEDTPFVLVKNQRSDKKHSNNTVGTRNDGSNIQGRSNKVARPKFGGFATGSMPQTRGEFARSIAEQQQLQKLRDDAVSKLLSTTEVFAEDIVLEDDNTFSTPRFSVTGAPTPTPTETKVEYLKRYMEWRENQVEQAARTKFVKDMEKADKFFEKAAKKIVDRNKPIDDFQKAVVAQGGKLNVGNNAYADTTMAIGRAGYQVRRFADHQLKNMLDAIREMMDSKLLDNIVLTWDNMDTEYTDPKKHINGKRLTVRELIGVYCQAMDVKEAKDKGLPDRGEAGFKKNLRDANGNEVSYEDVIRMVHDAVVGTNLTKRLWRSINDATKFALRYQLAAGMIDRETFDKYDRDYYVPERGWRERDLDGREEKYNESQGMTNGSPYNAALQKAKGRDSLASDPFAYIQSIAETSILSAEKNKVKQKFLQFVFDNEEVGRKTGAWNIRKVWLVEGANGQPEVSFAKPADESKIIKGYATESQIKLASEVKQRTRAERLQHQVIVMRDGVQYIVELESEELANTLNGKYEGMNDLWEGWGNVQRSMVNYMSAINTQYNPVFPVFNFIRDFQLAMISNIGEQDAKFTANFMLNIGKVQGAIWKYVANEKYRGIEVFKLTTIGKYLEEYFEQGAQTGFSFLRDIEALNVEIDKALTEGKFKRGSKKTKDVILGTLSMMTEVSELTVRVAQYVTARESGYSAEEAAQMAKEISVNFDRKGTESRALSKLYSFFNASIQGTNKIWRMLKHSKRARRTLLGASALYMALGILNTLLNPDDPEEDVWASDYTRKTNFLFGKYRIPVAHFFRIFYGAGVEIVLAWQGRKTVKQAIFDTANFTADELVPSSLFQVHNLWEYNEVMNEVEFNPAQYVQGAVPSWITPLTDVAMNRNFMGGKINKEPYVKSEEGRYKAGKYAMKNTDEFWVDMADLLSGGDSSAARNYEEGKGVSGSTLQHIFEGYVGQAGKFVLDAGALPIKAAKGEEITTKDIPYVNRLIVPYKQESAYNQEYWTLKNDIQHYEFLLKQMKKEDKDAYYKEKKTNQYKTYKRIEKLVDKKPKEGDTHTPEDVRKLMEANKEWRRLK